MEKEKTYYERVDPLEWAESYTFEEFIRLVGTKFESDPIFVNKARTLKATITDGDYTLQEGLDYETHYFRGHGKSEMVWFAVAIGKGNYDKMFFHAGECRLSSCEMEMRQEPNYEEFMKLFYPDEETLY